MTGPAAGDPDEDEQAVLADLGTLALLEQAGQRAPLWLGPMTAFEMISGLQLAMRHPELPADQRDRIEAFVRAVADGWFRGRVRKLIERGFDPANDLVRPPVPDPVGITCPRCHRTSHHPDDAKYGWCAACHAFTSPSSPDPWGPA